MSRIKALTVTRKSSYCHTQTLLLSHIQVINVTYKGSYCHTQRILLSHTKAPTVTHTGSYCHTQRLLLSTRFLQPHEKLLPTYKKSYRHVRPLLPQKGSLRTFVCKFSWFYSVSLGGWWHSTSKHIVTASFQILPTSYSWPFPRLNPRYKTHPPRLKYR
jgi:hypothetical protein